MTLTLERDIHKFRVVQGESIYQATGIAPFSHDLRKGGPGGKSEEESVRASSAWIPPPLLSDPTHTLVEKVAASPGSGGGCALEQISCRLVAMFLAGASQRNTWHLSIWVSLSRAT